MRRKSKTTDKPRKKPPYNQSSAIRSALRRAFSRSPIVKEVLMDGRREIPKLNKNGKRSKKDSVQYQCQTCSNWVASTKINVDHVDPVVPTDGSFDSQNPDWNMYIRRLWCSKSNLYRICKNCHDAKSAFESEIRKQIRKQKKQEGLIKWM